MLRINTLGGWRLTRDDGRSLEIPAQRVALLALLVAAGDRGVSRDRAAALLWPDSTDEKARHSLGQSIYGLRRDAAAAEVILGTATLRLNSDVVACDAWDLDASARAGDAARVVALYGGRFLDGVHLRGSAELEHALDAERVRLARLYADALEALARVAAGEGRWEVAASWWRRLAATEPLSSRVAMELVRSLVAAGDRTAALQAARVHEALVRDELDAEPDPAFMDLAQSLRREPDRLVDHDRSARHATALGDAGNESDRTVEAGSPAADAESVLPNAAIIDRHRWLGRRFFVGSLAAATLLAVLGGQRVFFATEPLETKRVYVASFENRTGDAALDPVGAMASDWVSQGLEQSGVVTVVSAARAEDARPITDAPRRDNSQAARQAAALGAGTVVSGAFYKVGDRLRFHVQIHDVARAEVLDSFDAVGATTPDPSDALETVRQRTVGSLASFVDPRLRSWVRVASKPPTYDAYREFVTGQSIWGSDHRQALLHFSRASDLDSSFYAARVEAATLHRLLGECGRTESIARELSAVRDRLAPYDFHALDVQVAQCEGDWERAYRQARAVADLRPRSAFLEYSLALQAMQLGRFAEARDLLDHHTPEQGVAEVGPNYAIVYAQVLATRGDRPRGLHVARWLRARYPNYSGAWGMEATLLARMGRVHETEQLIDTMVAVRLEPRPAVVTALRRVAASFTHCGDTSAARRTLTRALDYLDAGQGGGQQTRQRSERAKLLYELGRIDEAEVLLKQVAPSDSGDVDVRGYLGLIAARRHDTASVTAVDGWLESARPSYVLTRTMYRARMAALLGDRERALTLLSAGLDEMGRFLIPGVREYAEFVSLRSDDRFARLMSVR